MRDQKLSRSGCAASAPLRFGEASAEGVAKEVSKKVLVCHENIT
jgi:hypothetical protein